jgi:hypothetical protein
MEIQTLIVVLIVAAAAAYFASGMLKKAKAFRPKSECGEDCGCGSTSKKAVR